MWSRWRAAWREEGVRGLWFRGLGRAGYRRLQIWERPIDLAAAPELPPGFRLREIGPEDLERYLRFRADQTEPTLRQRWQRGERCHVVEHGGAIVNCGWSGTGVATIEFLRCRMVLPSDVVYAFDGATAAPYRRRGLGRVRALYVAQIYGAAGFQRVASATLPENPGARRLQQRLGSRPIGMLRRWPWSAGWIERSWPGSLRGSRPAAP